jgi:hypothetical protein
MKVSLILIIFGMVLVVSAATFWADTLTTADPPGLGETMRN